eukprot:2711303-Rhodomonas_salina.1
MPVRRHKQEMYDMHAVREAERNSPLQIAESFPPVEIQPAAVPLFPLVRDPSVSGIDERTVGQAGEVT